MPIEEFEDMLSSTVTIAPLTSHDRYGAATYGTAVSYKARISYQQHWIRRRDEQPIQSRGEVWTNGVTAINTDAKLTLPAGSPGNLTPPILDVQQPTDENGNIHHTKIIFG